MSSSNRSAAARSACLVLVSASAATVLTWRVLQWRARKKARLVAERARRMIQDGPMVDCSDQSVTMRLLDTATRRASKWLSYQSIDGAKPMIGQVGGISFNKRPVLTLPPDYVLKPLHTDHRGFREVAFYEAVKIASLHGRSNNNAGGGTKNGTSSAATAMGASSFGGGGKGGKETTTTIAALETCDAVAMMLAMFLHDAIVAESEETVVSSWKAMHREIELLKRLSSLTASYYGVIGQEPVPNPTENPTVVPPGGPTSSSVSMSAISSKSHLLLSDLTANFAKPCAIDVKIGQRSFEPGAAPDKKEREIRKYPQQEEFGFRIVGMRIYDPTHPESDLAGFRSFDKIYGRSLSTREEVQDALRLFFTYDADAEQQFGQLDGGRPGGSVGSNGTIGQDGALIPIRTRVISNLLSQLRGVTKWFEENKSLAFYSSSILMVYEGDLSVGANRDVTNLRMIDFGHVIREAGGDKGYVHGLSNVSQMFREIYEEATR